MTTTHTPRKRKKRGPVIITLLTIALVYTITSITAQPDTPIVTNDKLVYFDDGTRMQADSLCNVCIGATVTLDEIVTGETYRIAYTDNSNRTTCDIFTIQEILDKKTISFINGTTLTPDSLAKICLKPIRNGEVFDSGKSYYTMRIGNNGEIVSDTLVVKEVKETKEFLFSNGISLEETSIGMIATKKDICCKEIEKGTELTLMYIDRNGNIINKRVRVDTIK